MGLTFVGRGRCPSSDFYNQGRLDPGKGEGGGKEESYWEYIILGLYRVIWVDCGIQRLGLFGSVVANYAAVMVHASLQAFTMVLSGRLQGTWVQTIGPKTGMRSATWRVRGA